MYCSRKVRYFHLFQTLCRKTCRCYSKVKHLGNGCSYRAFVFHLVAEHHIVGHDSCLTVCRPCKEVEPWLACYWMRELYSIAHRIYVGIRCLKIFIYVDTLHFAQFQSCLCRKSCFCTHTDREYHQLGSKRDSGLEVYIKRSAVIFERLNRLFKIQLHALLLQMFVHECCHGIVDRSHYLVCHFHYSHFHSGVLEVFSHLKTDKTATNNNGTLYSVLADIFFDFVSIVYVSQREYTLAVYPLQRRNHRRCSRRQQKFVVLLCVFSAVLGTHSNCLILHVNRYNFRICSNVDIESLAESLRSLHEQFISVVYQSAYIIRQSTIGIRNVLSFLEHDNLSLLRVSANSCRRGGTPCHTSYYKILHNVLLFSIYSPFKIFSIGNFCKEITIFPTNKMINIYYDVMERIKR